MRGKLQIYGGNGGSCWTMSTNELNIDVVAGCVGCGGAEGIGGKNHKYLIGIVFWGLPIQPIMLNQEQTGYLAILGK